MNIEIVTIGDELLLGFTIDTNAAHIAQTLGELGVVISRRTTVGDDESSIASAVADALARADGVITTGGIGPTADDITKDAVAALLGKRMVMDDRTVADLAQLWSARGFDPMPVNARRQALVPEGAELLDNRHGSAPGLWLDTPDGRFVAMIPGVPREMRGLLADAIVPRLRDRARGGGVVSSRTLRTTGLPESHIADLVGALPLPEAVSLAYLPSWHGVDLRLTIRGVAADIAAQRLAAAAEVIRVPVGRSLYGEDSADLAAIVIEHLIEREWTIGTGESCTGGLAAERLTSVPGASAVVRGSVVAYDNEVKNKLLSVSFTTIWTHGAVCEEVAGEMASGARRALGSDVGIGITGIAGPGGATPGKPVGMVCLAVEWPGGGERWTSHFPGDRAEVRFRATQAIFACIAGITAGQTSPLA